MKRAISALLAGSALVLAVGCGSSSSSGAAAPPPANTGGTSTAAPTSSIPAKSGTATVKYQNIAISPADLTVKVGTNIKWINLDSTPHNVTSQSGPAQIMSPDFSQGGSYSFTATKPGVIHYICTIHPASMVGTVTVVQ